MHRPFLAAGFAFGLIGVAAGAFATHGLRGSLDAASLATFETAVRYQMYHALALVGVGLAAANRPGTIWSLPGFMFTGGTVVFSGSLYALAVTGIGAFGAIAPLGGASLILGWGAALLAAVRMA